MARASSWTLAAWLVIFGGTPVLAQSEPYKVFDTRPVVTQGPYLVATSDTTATIVWLTDAPSHAAVRYARGTGLPASALTNVVEASRNLFGYVPTPEGRFYYARDAGPVHLILLDTGEDKADDTNVYAGLNRTTEYRAAELAWLREHVRTHPRVASAPFRVIAMHQPRWGWLADGNAAWIAAANEARVDLVLAGHMHRFLYEPPNDTHRYHLVVVGQDQVARIDAWTTELTVTVESTGGKMVHSMTIPRAGSRR